MPEAPTELRTNVNKDAGEQSDSIEGTSPQPGSRTLRAGGEFLKAVASDLAVLASRLRLWLIAKHRFVKAAAGDLAVLASRLRLWLIAKFRFAEAAVGDLAVRASRGPGSRTLRAGGVFLTAIAGDLAALASRLRLWLSPKLQSLKAAGSDLAARASRLWPLLIPKHRQTPRPRASTPSRAVPPSVFGTPD
jgi:hypothetical protein